MGKHNSTDGAIIRTPSRARTLLAVGVGFAIGASTVAGGFAAASGSSSTPSVYSAIAPVNVFSRTLAGGSQTDFAVTGGAVPANATSVVISATALNGTTTSSLYLYATGDTKPTSANLRWNAGQTVTVPIVVAVGTGGKVHVTPDTGSIAVKFSVVGYYSPAPASGSAAIASSVASVSLSSHPLVIASIALPAGLYDVQAKTVITTSQTNYIQCSLFDETAADTLDSSSQTMPPTGDENMMMSSLDETSGTTVQLICNGTSQLAIALAENIQLMALQLSSASGSVANQT
jgi:hypothetical protein